MLAHTAISISIKIRLTIKKPELLLHKENQWSIALKDQPPEILYNLKKWIS